MHRNIFSANRDRAPFTVFCSYNSVPCCTSKNVTEEERSRHKLERIKSDKICAEYSNEILGKERTEKGRK